jgi:MFS transporter, UMF1 family
VTAGADGGTRWRAARRGRLGWYGYDWANSVFSTVVTGVFFGPFITETSERAADADRYVHPLGIPVYAGSLFPYLVMSSVLLQILVLPTAAGLTRRRGKGVALGALSSCGAGATICMYAIEDTDYAFGAAMFLVATIALGASITVANAYLPIVAPPERQDRTSAQASAAGFLGGGIALLAALYVYVSHEAWGLTENQAVRIIMLGAGVWWLVFGAISVLLLRGYGSRAAIDASPDQVGAYRALFSAFRQLRRVPGAGWFLVAFLLYNNGMQSVTSLVGTYAAIELGLPQNDIVVIALTVQLVAVAGAVGAGWLAERYGGRQVLLGIVIAWAGIVVAGGLVPDRAFWVFLAVCVSAGIVLGGTYALARSVFLGMVPADRMSEYSGIFETVNRCLGFIGPGLFGLVLQWTGSYRSAWTSNIVFFLAGALVLAAGSATRLSRRKALAVKRTRGTADD